MPDIPNLPGVPSLPSYSPNTVGLVIADAFAVLNFLFGAQWGIFLNGAQAFPYNSILDIDYKNDNPTSDYPVEDGSFLSYDKVQLPFDVRMRVASGGSEFERQALLDAVLSAAQDLNLYDVVTPEQTYSDCNITHVDYKRSAINGVGVIVVDIWFVEIRQTATATFSNTQNPSVAGQQNTGSVAPQTPNAQTSGLLTDDSGNSMVT
jgi:hypothetical protein